MSGSVAAMSNAGDAAAVLPFVDEHRVLVRAAAPEVWRAVGASFAEGGTAVGVVARVLATVPDRRIGALPAAGSAVPGFAVHEAVPDQRLVLVGRHRFSDYRLTFALAPREGGTELSARTEARFPGLWGRAYRALVIGSGGHAVITRRWLRRIGRSAERR